MIPRRNASELATMRRAGRVVAEMHHDIRAALRPGVTTAELDRIGRAVLERRGAQSNFLGYHGYPAVICASVNEVVIHGIPGDRVLADGDLISIDCGAIVDGWHGDAAFTAGIGEISDASARLLATADAALDAAIACMVPDGHLGDIGHAVESLVLGAGYDVVHDYCGHGIGRAMHERPDVRNFGERGSGPKLRPGNVLAIEPMLVAGVDEVVTLEDDWTVVTLDRSWSAHVEHTVLVTENGPEILTVL